MNKNTLISVVVIILVVIVGYMLVNKNKQAPADPVQMLDTETQVDSTTSIDTSLEAIDIDSSTGGDLDSIDADLNNL